MPKKKLGVVLLLIWLFSVLPVVNCQASWYSGRQYRKSHALTGDTVTDYQHSLTVHYGSGADGAGDVYLFGRCQGNFSDIIITASDGITALAGAGQGWMQTNYDYDNATIWFLTSAPTTIYVYYGNATTTWQEGGAASVFAAILSDVVIGLPMEENTGAVTYDVSGNGNNADLVGGNWTSGKFGYGIALNGTTDYLKTVTQCYPKNDFSMSLWFYLDVNNTAQEIFGTRYDRSNVLLVGDDISLNFYNASGDATAYVANLVSAGVWNHLVAVKSSASGPKVYLNGVSVVNGTGTNDIQFVDAYLRIGAQESATYKNFLDGVVDEVYWFSGEVSAANALNLCNYYSDPAIETGSVYLRQYASVSNGVWGSEETEQAAISSEESFAVALVFGVFALFIAIVALVRRRND